MVLTEHPTALNVLMRTFFHDLTNTAGGIQGYARLISEESLGEPQQQDDLRRMAALSDQLLEDINSQRDLIYAESGDLATDPSPIAVRGLLEDLKAMYSNHAVAAHRSISLRDIWDGQIVADRRMLARVLGNMIKNALEAVDPGATITVRCFDQGEDVAFTVHNASVMPEHVQLQVFQRSFSTKGETGRGIGTHSMKLFGERYLGGKVDFISREGEGTTFTFVLPKTPRHVA